MISRARDQMKRRSGLAAAENALRNRARTAGCSIASAAQPANTRGRTRWRVRTRTTIAATRSPRYAARSNVKATASSPAPHATPTAIAAGRGRARAARAPPNSASRTAALCPNVRREVKKPIAPNRPSAPGAWTRAGSCRRPSRWTRSRPVRYCSTPRIEAQSRPPAAQRISCAGARGCKSRSACATTKKPRTDLHSVAAARSGHPWGESASERIATATNATAGRSSGVRSGRGGESSTPAAATASAICIPAMEIGRKNACAVRPASASAAAIFRRSKSGLHTISAAMSLLDRLLLREIIMPLGVGMLAVLQLLVILQLLQLNEVVFSSAVTLEDLLRVTAALAPHFLVVAVPVAFMLGVQLGLGRLAADQGVLALSAAGTHPPRFMIYVSSEDPAEPGTYATWRGVLIEDDVGDGAPVLALAELGHIEDTGGPAIALRLFQGELHRMEAKGETVARFKEGRFVVGVQESVMHKNKFARNEAAMTEPMMRARLAELARRGEVRESARLRVDLVRRWAVPLACFAFAFLGVPLAVLSRGGRASAYIITVGMFIGFYALSRFGVALAENGLNAWIAGFLPDAVVLALGGAYTWHLVRNGIGKQR